MKTGILGYSIYRPVLKSSIGQVMSLKIIFVQSCYLKKHIMFHIAFSGHPSLRAAHHNF